MSLKFAEHVSGIQPSQIAEKQILHCVQDGKT